MDDQRSEQVHELAVSIPIDGGSLEGDLRQPASARGIVLFAHGSGSGRKSPRNQQVARSLNEAGLATLLIDLLTPEEEQVDMQTRHLRFDIGLLGQRLVGAIDWLQENSDSQDLRIGLFGASTGAAGALVAAAERPGHVRAVVSRGGRPDLAGEHLSRVEARTLLIVGGRDEPVIGMNQDAVHKLGAETRLEIVSGATHLFEEPGKLEEVARLASEWFTGSLRPDGGSASQPEDPGDTSTQDQP